MRIENGGLLAAVVGYIFTLVCAANTYAATDTPSEAEAVVAKPVDEAPYVPTPENLAARKAFQDDRFGVFIHWGTYSVLGRGEWVMNIEKIPVNEYEKLPSQFNPEKFNAAEWVGTFKKAGAKYITITSKHHDGFALFPSDVTEWDIANASPYGKDLIGPLAEAARKRGLKFGCYYSQAQDWNHPGGAKAGARGRLRDRGAWLRHRLRGAGRRAGHRGPRLRGVGPGARPGGYFCAVRPLRAAKHSDMLTPPTRAMAASAPPIADQSHPSLSERMPASR